jgi:hypothetical protein
MIDFFVEDNTPLMPAHFTEPDEIETRYWYSLCRIDRRWSMFADGNRRHTQCRTGNNWEIDKTWGVHTEMLPMVFCLW